MRNSGCSDYEIRKYYFAGPYKKFRNQNDAERHADWKKKYLQAKGIESRIDRKKTFIQVTPLK